MPALFVNGSLVDVSFGLNHLHDAIHAKVKDARGFSASPESPLPGLLTGSVPFRRMTMSDTALAFESIASLSGRIGSGSLSPVKYAEDLLNRIDALDDRLRSFIRP